MKLDLSELEALILDVDGVLYEGSRALPGAVDLVAQLRAEGTRFLLLSNNTFRPVAEHVRKLAGLGIEVSPDEILTAAVVTAKVLAREARNGARCYVVGEAGLAEALNKAGLEVVGADCQDADYVVVGMDRELTYAKLKAAALLIRRGAQFISSNPDPAYPTDEGLVPASGAIQAALEAATGVPARVIGKPEPAGFQLALETLGSAPQATAMVGDQLASDILGAQRIGLRTILVLSSVTPSFDPARSIVQPDAVFASTAAFLDAWRTSKWPS